jgi:hypothetical protein
MGNLITLFSFIMLSITCFSQYPKWMPEEFKNKVFCGEFNCSGKMIGGSTAFNNVPYEIRITEDGIQIKINPGERFGHNEWGETIKIKFKTSSIFQSPEFSFFKQYYIDLTSSNETSDSPLHPKYNLKSLTFCVSNYNNQPLNRDQQRSFDAYPLNKSWIEFDVYVPYYESGGPGKGTWPNAVVCSSVKSAAEIQKEQKKLEEDKINWVKEDAILKPQIKNLLAEKKLVEAIEKYDALNLQETKNALFSEMQLALSGYYKTFEQPFSNDKLTNFIIENKSTLSNLAQGNHKISIDSEGKITINETPTGLKTTPLTRSFGQNSEFTVNTMCSGTIKIETLTKNYGYEQIEVSTIKTIYQTRKGKLYKKVFLGQSNNDPTVSVTFNRDVPKNKYRIVQPFKIITTANDIEINSKLDSKLLSEEKFKSRALTISYRTLSISVAVFFTSLRIYEFFLIP